MKKRTIFAALVLGGIVFLTVRACVPGNPVPASIGEAATARPLPPQTIPVHPFLAEPQRSGMHGGSYNSDVSAYAGPLGRATETRHRMFGRVIGVAPNISFDAQGRLITVAIKWRSVELHLLDPDTLETLALYKMPKKDNWDNSGGGYFHLDAENRPILAPNDNSIKILDVVEQNGGYAWQVVENWPLGDLLPDGANIHDVMPDWAGNLWFVTTGNILGYRNAADGHFHTVTLPDPGETIQNSFAVAEDGVFVVSTHALYRFEIDAVTRAPVWSWRAPYQRGEAKKPGTLSHGSGTSPTLIGDDLIAIADDASPQTHINVYRRGSEIDGPRQICSVPVFTPEGSATENSLVSYQNALIVQNDYGHEYIGNALETVPGVTRVDIDPDRQGCHTVWENDLRSQSLPRLSTATGLLYFYTFKLPFEGARTGGWYLTAVDFETGEDVFDRLVGAGSGGLLDRYGSVTAPVVLGPNEAAYVGIRTGIIRAADAP